MNNRLKNILYTCLLGCVFLTNTVNFHAFTHLFESDENSFVECDFCSHIIQQENQLGFAPQTQFVTVSPSIDYSISKPFIYKFKNVKKTIITDYFFNKPPPVSVYFS